VSKNLQNIGSWWKSKIN